DSLRADQAHDLLDLVHQGLRGIVKQEMRLVKEEHELRLVRIANLWKHLEQLRQHPQQEGRVELRALHQFVGRQDVDDTASIAVDAHEILQIERGLGEE